MITYHASFNATLNDDETIYYDLYPANLGRSCFKSKTRRQCMTNKPYSTVSYVFASSMNDMIPPRPECHHKSIGIKADFQILSTIEV